MMRSTFRVIILLALTACMATGCRSVTEPPAPAPNVQTTEDERITITDALGKVWDITDAVNEYAFDPQGFEYGVGIGTIPPVFDPEFVGPDEPGYPSSQARFQVMTTRFGEEIRAYAIAPISTREVINDRFGDAHVMVAY